MLLYQQGRDSTKIGFRRTEKSNSGSLMIVVCTKDALMAALSRFKGICTCKIPSKRYLNVVALEQNHLNTVDANVFSLEYVTTN